MHPVDVSDDVFEHVADVFGPDEDGLGARKGLLPHSDSSALPRIEY